MAGKVITVRGQLVDGSHEAFLEIARKIEELTPEGEHGCRLYQFFTAVENPSEWLLFEIWDDEAGIASHLETLDREVGRRSLAPLSLGLHREYWTPVR